MTAADQARWDERYRDADRRAEPNVPEVFARHSSALVACDTALELACGVGRASVWLAMQDLSVSGYDVSPVAVEQAATLAERHGVASNCSFAVADLDAGLPDGDPVGLILCHRFRDERLDQAIMARLAPAGLLAIAALSEVGAEPGRFRTKRGALKTAFAALEYIDGDEADGVAWLLARKR